MLPMQSPSSYAIRSRSNQNAPPVTFSATSNDERKPEFLRTTFGQKYDDLINKYGVDEFIYDEAGVEVLDVVSPEEYLAEVDNRILHALETGAPDNPDLVPSSQLLHRLARAEVSFLHSVTTLLRSDPQYLRSVIESTAQYRTELIPDENGAAPKVEDILKNSDYLATEIRYAIHNTLLVLGQWVLVEKLLKELVELEEDVGYMAAQDRRQTLMDRARDLVEQAMNICARRLSRILVAHPKFQKFWVRKFNYEPKWTGARIEARAEDPYATELRQSRSLDGALCRFSFIQTADPEALTDLFLFFTKATPDETQGLGDYMVESISQLHAFCKYYCLLGMRDKSQRFESDSRLLGFKSNSEQAQKILASAAIERYLKNIDSVAQEKSLQKIWKEFDNISQKKAKVSLEKLIGYEKLQPKWYIPPRRPRVRAASSATAPTGGLSLRPPREPAPGPPAVTHDPVRLTPVSYLSAATANPVEETFQRTEPKVKTTGVPNPPSSSSPETKQDEKGKKKEESEEEAKSDTQTTFFDFPFYVKSSVYEVFEMLFNPAIKGQVRQGDFISAMCSLGWEYVGSSMGSRARLVPPSGNQPLHMHIKHGGDGDKMSAPYEHSYAKRLTEDYGFTLDSFRIKE